MTNTKTEKSALVEGADHALPLLEALTPLAYTRRKAGFISIVALQIIMMLCTAVPAALTLTSGKTVVLKTKPIDPYDMFRGDYVHLRYDLNDITTLSPGAKDGDTVYVALHARGRYWYPRVSATTKPLLLPGEICIKGQYQANYCQIHYGIEQVFVPEKTGQVAEKAKSLDVEVAVDDKGNAVIKKVTNADATIYDAREKLSLIAF